MREGFPMRAFQILHPRRFVWVLVLTLGLWAIASQAREFGDGHGFRYRYVSLDQIKLPAGFTLFFPVAIQDSGRVYGSVCDTFLCSDIRNAFYKDGTVTVLPSRGFAFTVNAGGTVGGAVLADPVNFILQAALFRGDVVTLIPPQPGEVSAFVIALNDSGTALVQSFDASGNQAFLLYSKGQTTRLDFGPTIANPAFLSRRSINNEGIIAGREGPDNFDGARGFRFDPRTGKSTLLNPFPGDPTETLAWGLGINTRDDVLGYSFTNGIKPYHERVGVWDRKGDFKTYFVETMVSSNLLFNDNNLIVITQVADPSPTSYLVPKPGVRLNLADLVGNLPAGQDLSAIIDMNNHGDMIGSSSSGNNFLLQRRGEMESEAFVPAAGTAVKNKLHAIPPVIAAIRRLILPQLHKLK
jgi:hypothetical protein